MNAAEIFQVLAVWEGMQIPPVLNNAAPLVHLANCPVKQLE